MGNNESNKIINENDKIYNQIENSKEEDNEIIIELEIKMYNVLTPYETYILCNKNDLEKNMNKSKKFCCFNKYNTKLYLNDKEIEFKYKLKFNEIGINKIKVKSNLNLISLSSMFYNCSNIINIKFIKFNTNNVTDMNNMFLGCIKLSELNLSSFNTNNVTDMNNIFLGCVNLDLIKINKLYIKKFKEIIDISKLKI